MTLVYPFRGNLPILLGSVACLLTQRRFLARFLIDTGSCHTCLPSSYATAFGHSNEHPEVKKFVAKAIGGDSNGYIHGFRFGLIDPGKAPKPGKNWCVWEASASEICFMERFESCGLLGMDVISEWQEFKLTPRASGGGLIHITV